MNIIISIKEYEFEYVEVDLMEPKEFEQQNLELPKKTTIGDYGRN